MAGCGCIPPPPDFDLPPPPDPSLIWDLLSDEPLAEFKELHYGQCEFNLLLGVFQSDEVYFPGLLCIFFVTIAIGCLVGACVYRKRRNAQKRCQSSSLNSTTKTSSGSAETVVTSNNWPYNTVQTCNVVPFARKGFASSHSTSPLCQHQPIVAHANQLQGTLVRTLPQADCRSARTLNGNIVLHGHCCAHVRPTADICSNAGYCTLSSHPPHYEEIAVDPQHYAANPVYDPQTYEERFLTQRRPPPQCRPPPPPPLAPDEYHVPPMLVEQLRQKSPNYAPSTTAPKPFPRQRGSNSTSSSFSASEELHSGSDVDPELYMNKFQARTPPDVLPQPPCQELRGRESGYGTGTKRGNWVDSPRQNLKMSFKPFPQNAAGPSSTSTLPPHPHSPLDQSKQQRNENMTYV